MSVVYILKRNDTPGIYKVGWSRYSGQNRAANYTDGNWIVHKEFSVPSYLAEPIERKAHSILKKDGHWLNPAITEGSAQEIFRCDSKAAELAVMNAIKIVAITTKEEASKLVDESSSFPNSIKEPKIEKSQVLPFTLLNFAKRHLPSITVLLAAISVILLAYTDFGILWMVLAILIFSPTIYFVAFSTSYHDSDSTYIVMVPVYNIVLLFPMVLLPFLGKVLLAGMVVALFEYLGLNND